MTRYCVLVDDYANVLPPGTVTNQSHVRKSEARKEANRIERVARAGGHDVPVKIWDRKERRECA
jgi:hypothetical protein